MKEEDFKNQFTSLALKHVVTIPDDLYIRYTEQSKSEKSIYPNSLLWQGYASTASREEVIKMALATSSVKYNEYFDEKDQLIIGEIKNSKNTCNVYFCPALGAYYVAYEEDLIYEIWLSWPAYPQGW